MRKPPTSTHAVAAIERAVGASTYARGWVYAQSGHVAGLQFDPHELALSAMVLGAGQQAYATTVYLEESGDCGLSFEQGQCSCPVGIDCKHAVAVALAAPDVVSGRLLGQGPPAVQRWEQSLRPLLDATAPILALPARSAPLALQLSIPRPPQAGRWARASSAIRVLARPVTRGKTGNWIKGNLSWSTLSHLNARSEEHPPEQVRWFQELHALYQAPRGGSMYYHPYQDNDIDLTDFDSRRLWSLLDEAARLGIEVVHTKKNLGNLPPYASAAFALDITRTADDTLVITPTMQLDGASVELSSTTFIGAEAHGLAMWDGADAATGRHASELPLRLARLDKPVPTQLQAFALSGEALKIPPDAQARFLSEYFPVLRQRADIVSSDDSFTPPLNAPPRLVVRASYGDEHQLDVDWEWSYTVGDDEYRAPLTASGSADRYRDLAREQDILANLDASFNEFGLSTGSAAPAPTTTLRGIDTVRATNELLPLLAGYDDVLVEVEGDPARYREVSDAVEIGVSTSATHGDNDWFNLGVTITVDGHDVPFLDVFSALAREESHLLLAGGAYFSLEKPELQRLKEVIGEARALQESPTGPMKISRFQAGLWEELASLGVVRRQAKAWREQVTGLLSIGTVTPASVPSSLHAELRPYQQQGFDWLVFLWTHRLGGILADDMGLGKTLQSLALICHARAARPADAPFLIVAPTSVVSNWAGECARFIPELKVVAVTETQARRGESLAAMISGADVVLTSYTLFRLDFPEYTASDWSALILDEAQFTKNHQSKVYQCARRLEAPFKLAITGTPMENNLMELWSLLSISAPGLFANPTQFGDYYRKPIEKQGDTALLAQLRRRIKPLVLRRTKKQVATELPDKQEQVLEVELEPRHRKIYDTHLQRERQKVLGLIGDMNKNRFTIFRSLTLLRQLSLDATLVDDTYTNVRSAKIEALLEQLGDVIAGGHRALVFSQFTGFLAKVRARLDAEGVNYCYLDGKTRNRVSVLEQFKSGDAPVFLISLKAGGFGLNLTEADYCFLLDPWWNPATEAQAVDRTHRIGQTRNVMVYRLIAKDTIEEKVMALKERKSQLFSSVMDADSMLDSSLSAADIRGLFE